jgi:myo-inositol 2-dehydrogenase/D-chiro-inositol 1-dehydrogenase
MYQQYWPSTSIGQAFHPPSNRCTVQAQAHRRGFLKAAASLAGYHLATCRSPSRAYSSPNERPRIGAIGLRYQGTVIANQAKRFGDIVAVCDVDRHVRDQAKAAFGSTPYSCENYRDLLDRKDVDVVTIGAPDHWHSQMLIDACRAGKDVYCEKPLTLTVDEGKLVSKAVQQTARVVQVGSWQRSDERFRLAVEMVRAGRIGKLQQVDVVLGKNVTGGPFASRTVPGHLNWNLWQGQTLDVPYVEERCHYTFRWWWEYSGGQMTDWGAHHIDIAQWGIDSLPIAFEGTSRNPQSSGGYNVPIDFESQVTYANGVVMNIRDHGDNGILFTGDQGRLFVNRGKITGLAVEELSSKPLPREDWKVYPHDNLDEPLRSGKLDSIVSHMHNFFECIQTRKPTISDVYSQHRSVSTCHLANIAIRLGRPVRWDPLEESCIDDPQANQMLSREQRHGFEVG